MSARLPIVVPYAIVVGSAATSAPSGTWTSVSFGTTPALLTDPFGFYSASNPTRLTVPAGMAGFYQVVGCVALTANVTGVRLARILLNAATTEVQITTSPAGTAPMLNPSVFMALVGGDYLELQGFHDSGATLSMSQATPSWPRLSLCKLV